MNIELEKVIPEENCFRFYTIRTEADFFEESALIIHWGRIGCPGRIRIKASGSERDCVRAGEKILKTRLRRGYTPACPQGN